MIGRLSLGSVRKYQWPLLAIVLGLSYWANPSSYSIPLWIRLSFTAFCLYSAAHLFVRVKRQGE